MLTALRFVLSKLVSPLWSSVEENGEGSISGACVQAVRHLSGSVVTRLYLDYGLIDNSVYFTSAEVLGGVVLKQGDLVNCIAVRGADGDGWNAVKVEKSSHTWEDGGQSSLEDDYTQLRPLVGMVTSFDGDGGYVNQTTYFPRSSLWEGYVPMKGDSVHAKFFINPTRWTSQAISVAPLRYCRKNQVVVTSLFGNSGVVNDSVFFSLDSLLLPANYQPVIGHLVNLVMVESSQSLYSWRALCMSPCQTSVNVSAAPLLDSELNSVLENKGGLEVTDYGQFGDVMIGKRHELVMWIQNKGSETHRLTRCDFAGWDLEEQFTIIPANLSMLLGMEQTSSQEKNSQPSEKNDTKHDDMLTAATTCSGVRREDREVDVLPGERLSLVISCQPKSLGSCTELLLLHFSSFIIGRRLDVTVSCEDENLLLPSAPYEMRETLPALSVESQVVKVSAPRDPPRLSKRCLPSFLPHFPVPQILRDCVEAKRDVLVTHSQLGEVLSASNMHSRFSTLLWLEELSAERELREFSISGALLRKGATYLYLEVHGLAEGRPSLNIGDKILLKRQSDSMVMEYMSYVTEINDQEVSLRVNSDFQRSYHGELLDVEFKYNRLTMRRCHNALEQAKHFGNVLFPARVKLQTPQWAGKWIGDQGHRNMRENETPTAEHQDTPTGFIDMTSKSTQTRDGKLATKVAPREGQFFNMDLNPDQKEAVKKILEGECRPMPYVLFGPPGTGKTITLIETILQVYHFLPSSRLLVCTPSNSAADLICTRLHYSGFLHAASLARVNASCRPTEFIPEVLRPYSRAGEDIRHAAFHRIVVSTCSSAGLFHNMGLPVGHFTHVFLDEAGQATEPESLIPISLVSEKDGQIVLAGDPHQLGPIVKSKLAAAFGLGLSFLERLMATTLYSRQKWGYNSKLVTKLIFNYRSHEALLSLPSKLFYHDELCFQASKDVTESLCNWKNLPKKGFPLLFHGVRGTEMREGNNPSWFNPVEAVQVMLYCCQLAKKLYKPVAASDIGIIAPYKKQCEKIRVLLGKVGLSDIKVGSVEEFQGQEFLVIILSTVRSSNSTHNEDSQTVLGFLSNPKRFNVAITRSKALLIIVGNPHILIQDPCFGALLRYGFDNGAYVGCDPP
uniref:RNA helicase n=2 Tax=Gouania willdenowi TaxID=441366 RepID=A0A8C5D6Z8_GOUWI